MNLVFSRGSQDLEIISRVPMVLKRLIKFALESSGYHNGIICLIYLSNPVFLKLYCLVAHQKDLKNVYGTPEKI